MYRCFWLSILTNTLQPFPSNANQVRIRLNLSRVNPWASLPSPSTSAWSAIVRSFRTSVYSGLSCESMHLVEMPLRVKDVKRSS
uniref:hypothetical protein n=1 Tax=Acaryochloris marina TaxID=155978 RepID=UPI0036F21A94